MSVSAKNTRARAQRSRSCLAPSTVIPHYFFPISQAVSQLVTSNRSLLKCLFLVLTSCRMNPFRSPNHAGRGRVRPLPRRPAPACPDDSPGRQSPRSVSPQSPCSSSPEGSPVIANCQNEAR